MLFYYVFYNMFVVSIFSSLNKKIDNINYCIDH